VKFVERHCTAFASPSDIHQAVACLSEIPLGHLDDALNVELAGRLAVVYRVVQKLGESRFTRSR
jgi:hypothetical protein